MKTIGSLVHFTGRGTLILLRTGCIVAKIPIHRGSTPRSQIRKSVATRGGYGRQIPDKTGVQSNMLLHSNLR